MKHVCEKGFEDMKPPKGEKRKMAKNRKKQKKTVSPEIQESTSPKTKDVVNIDEVNLRTVGPVTRVRGVVAIAAERLIAAGDKLDKWGEESSLAAEIGEDVSRAAAEIQAIADKLETLETSGFSPSRKSFTFLTKEGDHVSVLEKYRSQYDDLIGRELMTNLKVFRKNENRGGLILEAGNGSRIKVAAAHIVRLSQPKAA